MKPDPQAELPSPSPEEPSRSRSLRARSGEVRARVYETRRTLGERAEVLRERHASVRLAFEAYDRDRRRAGALLAGGLAYRLFLWMVPMSLVLATVFGLVADLTSRSPEEIAKSAGLAAALTATIGQAASDSGNATVVLLLVGLWALVLAGKSVVKALRLLSGVAWQIRPGPLSHSLWASAAFSGISLGLMSLSVLMRPLYAGPFVADLVVWVLTPIAVTPLFVWVFAWLPHPDALAWTAFLPGAALLAIGLQLLRIATSVYFVGRLDRVGDLYGAMGLATVFMVWLFLIGRLVVAGLAVNAERWRAGSAVDEAAA